MPELVGKTIAILATDGFEKSELFEPKRALENAGATVDIVSLKKGEIRSWSKNEWGARCTVDITVDQASPDQYDALMLPGGVINADTLRKDKNAVQFTRSFAVSGKPIAAICHAAWTLIETGFVKGHTMTSWSSLRTDLENAGAHWVDEEVVVDNGWVTSRKPDDIPAFNKKMIEEFKEGAHPPPQAIFYEQHL